MWVSIATCFFVMTKFKVEISAEWHAQTFFVFVHVTVQSWESQHYVCCVVSYSLMVSKLFVLRETIITENKFITFRSGA